jgi:hypothetical protein
MWNLVLVCLDTVLVLVQYWCMVFTERTTGSKIILDVASHFGPFGDSVYVGAI